MKILNILNIKLRDKKRTSKVIRSAKKRTIPVHITPKGVHYVHAEDILNSDSGRAIIRNAAKRELLKVS